MMGDDMTWIPDGSPNSIGRPLTPEEKKAYSAAEGSEPIHTYFGLSYSNYQVQHRALLQSMPIEWQREYVKLLKQYDKAFAHIKRAECYLVEPAEDTYLNEATDDQLRRGGYTKSEYDGDKCECTVEEECASCTEFTGPFYYDSDGNQLDGGDPITVPSLLDDPVPHYNRGRTRIEPRIELAESVNPADMQYGKRYRVILEAVMGTVFLSEAKRLDREDLKHATRIQEIGGEQ